MENLSSISDCSLQITFGSSVVLMTITMLAQSSIRTFILFAMCGFFAMFHSAMCEQFGSELLQWGM
jgi:hypothetical protein